MPAENEAAATAPKEKEPSFDEAFEAGWNKTQEEKPEDKPDKKETKAPEEKGEEKKVSAEEECPGCPKKAAEAKPYKTITVDGKQIPVKDEAELLALAQMGFDYTKKTQALSEKEKQFEKERSKVEELSEKTLKLLGGDKEEEKGREEKPPEKEETIEQIYARFGVDEYTDEATKNIIKELHEQKKETKSYMSRAGEAEKIVQVVVLKEALGVLGGFVNEARKEFPFEEAVEPESGKNLTMLRLIAALNKRFAEKPDRPIKETVGEIVKEIHLEQKIAKEKGGPEIKDDMAVEDFTKRFPTLAARYFKAVAKTAVADQDEVLSKLPPSTGSGRHEVGTTKTGSEKKQFGSLGEAVDKFFDDPANLENLTGEAK